MCLTECAFWCSWTCKMTSIVIITDLQTLTYEVNCSVYVYVYVSILCVYITKIRAPRVCSLPDWIFYMFTVYLVESFTCSLFTLCDYFSSIVYFLSALITAFFISVLLKWLCTAMEKQHAHKGRRYYYYYTALFFIILRQ